MAVAERVGHDKRRHPIIRRTADGKKVTRVVAEQDTVIDPATGEEKAVTVTSQEDWIDDELPEVAEAFRAWLAEAQP